MNRVPPIALRRAPTAARGVPRTRVGAALALARCEIERARLEREMRQLSLRASAAGAALAGASARSDALIARLRSDPAPDAPDSTDEEPRP